MSDSTNQENGTANDSPTGERGGFVALAVLAAALGAGAAILLAPDEGGETRKRVGRGLRSLQSEAADTVAQLRRELRRRKNQSRREKQIIAVAGLLVGAGVAALLTPERGAQVRQRLSGALGRIRVGAVDRIERLTLMQREAKAEPPTASVSESP
ncbi:MAG: YtxH domain-containing protein [Gemmatimonadales bacterium]